MSDDQLHSDREIIFGELLAAFGRHDHEVIRAAMRPDVILVMPGSSPLAGTYRGIDEVGRFVISLRVALDSGRHELDFEHDGDEMVVRHQVEVHGPQHVAGMILYQRFAFDSATGMITSITVEPEDRGLFDYVIHSRLRDSEIAVPS